MYLWLDGKKDEAFEALDCALAQLERFEKDCREGAEYYTAPLVRMINYDAADDDSRPHISYATLVEDWPWWKVPEESLVRPEIQADPRFDEWAAKTRAYEKKC